MNMTEKLREFWRNSPDEFLTYDDIMVKLGCSEIQARQIVTNLKKSGDVECHYVVAKRPGAKI